MCIHWCCKHCFTNLTHRWAYERCNEYFVARSQDENLISCPNGPWLLRRAYHRHPYRGPQRCDQCKLASREDKKLMQSARQKANVALGHRPDYNGAIYLGVLEMRETIHRNSRLPLEPGRLDAMKANWESFNVTHRHLPSHELEREWTKRFTASKHVDLEAVVSPSISKNTSIVGQRMNPKQGSQVSTAVAGEVTRDPHQRIYRQFISSTHEANGRRLLQAAPPFHYNHNSIIKRVNNTLETFSIAKQLILYQQNNDPTLFTNDIFTSVEETSSRSTGNQQQLVYNIRSEPTNKSNSSTVLQNEPSRDSGRSEVSSNLTSNTLSSSSRPTRTRPWDL